MKKLFFVLLLTIGFVTLSHNTYSQVSPGCMAKMTNEAIMGFGAGAGGGFLIGGGLGAGIVGGAGLIAGASNAYFNSPECGDGTGSAAAGSGSSVAGGGDGSGGGAGNGGGGGGGAKRYATRIKHHNN